MAIKRLILQIIFATVTSQRKRIQNAKNPPEHVHMLHIHLNFNLEFLSSFMLFTVPKWSENDEKKYVFLFF